MLILILIGTGIYNVGKLPIDAVPDITNNQVLVITSSPSLGAADIERLITFPIEQSTRNIPGIIEQRSFSRFGLSIVTIVFSDETDVYWARQQVSERLIEVQSQIPSSLGTPAMGPVTTGLGEIFQYVVKPKPGYESKYGPMELRTIQDWIVRRQLLGTEGVADVSSFGGRLKQYEIAVNTARLRSYNLSIADVFSALERNNQNTGGAYIERGPTALFIRSEGLVSSMGDIAQIMIKTLPNGSPVTIKDVASVKLGSAIRYGAVCYNDQGEVAGAVVMMLKNGNSSAVIKAVKKKIAEIEKTLPPGVQIEPFLDRTKMVNNAIGTVEKNLMEGALIVIFILVLFLGNLRAGLLVASVIPLSMLFAIIMMNLFGVSGNLMSLGALDFGLIVDGAVIIVEAAMHRLRVSKKFTEATLLDQQQMDTEVGKSASKMMNAAVFGQVIILIVYLPILSLSGIEGKMFRPMAETVAFAILGAFLLSLTYIPMMTSLFLSRKISRKKSISDRMMHKMERAYRKTLLLVLTTPKTVIAVSLTTFMISVVILLHMGGEFIPKLEEGDFAVDTRVLTGSSLTTTIKTTQQCANILLDKFPEVEKVVTKIGSGEIPTDPMPIEASDMMVILKPKKEWTSAHSFDELAGKMSNALASVPGVTAGFQFPVQMRFNELMTGGRQDVVCKIFGENIDTLSAYAERLGRVVRTVEGAEDLYVESVTGLPQIVINYNRSALAQYGLSIAEVNRTVQSAFAGAITGQVFENERRFDLVVRLDSTQRQNVSDVQDLLITRINGMQIPLRLVADVAIKVGPNQIQRENAQRRITVGFNVRGRDVESIVGELQNKVSAKLKLSPGYYITYGGDFENLRAAKKRLSLAVPVSLLLILVLLNFAFGSLKQGLMVFSAIPLSAIGGIFALWTRGMSFSISAGVGFIALFGVAVLNGIVLISEFNELKRSGVDDIMVRILRGTRTRLRPVLMTASVASLGFLPMALSTGAGAEVQRPLATVVIGGLITATALTLMLLPVLYLLFESKKVRPLQQRGLALLRNRSFLVVMTMLTCTAATQAQQRISLAAALDSAIKNSPKLQAAVLRTSYSRTLEGTAWDIPPAVVSGEYGKINSALNDNRVSLSQQVAFPVVYARQKKLLLAGTESSRLKESVDEFELRKEVTAVFYQLRVMYERKKILLKSDSLYSVLYKKQEERFRVGDINVLEKTSVESQRMQIASQLEALLADIEIARLRFGQLLNCRSEYVPEEGPARIDMSGPPQELRAENVPSLKWLKQQQDLALAEHRLQKSKWLPSLTLGYNNQSISGFQNLGGTEVYYDSGHRFSSVLLGINVPLFLRPLNSAVKAGAINYQIRKKEYEDAWLKQSTALRQLSLSYQKNKALLDYYEQTALKHADLLSQRASQQFASGNIGYLEWLTLINQAITIRAEYLNVLSDWNSLAIDIHSYQSKN